jgi:hypothetical protein
MKDADRFRLIGTYATPRVRVGTVLSCEVRDCDVQGLVEERFGLCGLPLLPARLL